MTSNKSFQKSAASVLTYAGILSAPIGLITLFYPPAIDKSLWGYPFDQTTHVIIAIFLVIVHLMKAYGFVGLAGLDGANKTVRWSMFVAVSGFVILAACEGISGALYGVPMDAPEAVSLNDGYGAGSMLFAIPSMIAGIVIIRKNLLSGAGKWSVFLSGAFMVFIVTPALIMGRDWPAYLALTVWSLFYLWIGLSFRRTLELRNP